MHKLLDFSYRLLAEVVIQVEKTQREVGRCNYLVAQYAGEVCMLLEYTNLFDRFTWVLKQETRKQHDSHAVANSPNVKKGSKVLRNLRAFSEIDKDYPPFPKDNRDYLAPHISKWAEPHLILCLNGKFENALLLAKTELAKEETLVTQILLGQIPEALESRNRLVDSYRQANVLFIATIESFRQRDFSAGQNLYDQLGENDLDIWGKSQMALAIAGRVPWQVYPYPDY